MRVTMNGMGYDPNPKGENHNPRQWVVHPPEYFPRTVAPKYKVFSSQHPFFSSPDPLFLFSGPPFSLLRTPFFSSPHGRKTFTTLRHGEEKKRKSGAEKRKSGAEKRKCTLGPPYPRGISLFYYPKYSQTIHKNKTKKTCTFHIQ